VIPTADRRILMADGAGVVEAVGAGVSEFQPGDRVVAGFFPQWLDGRPGPQVKDFSQTPGDGAEGFACQYVVRPASHFTHAPDGWSFREAATITTSGLTAWRALVVEGRLKAGDTVLTLGTGGVSITALQLAKSMGAQVIVTSSSDEKLARARALGPIISSITAPPRHGAPRCRISPAIAGPISFWSWAVRAPWPVVRGGQCWRTHRPDRRPDWLRRSCAHPSADE
jgi:NADPH:quinone reductase-like Zn-dependent oxidoreductase